MVVSVGGEGLRCSRRGTTTDADSDESKRNKVNKRSLQCVTVPVLVKLNPISAGGNNNNRPGPTIPMESHTGLDSAIITLAHANLGIVGMEGSCESRDTADSVLSSICTVRGRYGVVQVKSSV